MALGLQEERCGLSLCLQAEMFTCAGQARGRGGEGGVPLALCPMLQGRVKGSENSTFKVGLPGCYESVLVKVGE